MMENFLQESISNALAEFDKKKDAVIANRIKSLGIKDDIKEQSTKRFNKFLCEVRDNEETYYYNDGTDEGLRIVTFVNTPLEDGRNICGDDTHRIVIELKYY